MVEPHEACVDIRTDENAIVNAMETIVSDAHTHVLSTIV